MCETAELEAVARRVRGHVAAMSSGATGGHIGGSLSATDILVSLYCSVARMDPAAPDSPTRDYVVLSKGHAAIALYAVLAERGFLPVTELAEYASAGSRLLGHPVRSVPGVELATGSLGHGLGLGLGLALAARRAGAGQRCFVVLGDGELQEGAVWEAAMAAPALELGNLVAVVDRNGLQLTGRTEAIVALEPLAERWRSFGWKVVDVDGHDLGRLTAVLGRRREPRGQPEVVIAQTAKGKGVAFLEGRRESHFVTASPQLRTRLLAGLGEKT